jgi:hypothetical protein
VTVWRHGAAIAVTAALTGCGAATEASPDTSRPGSATLGSNQRTLSPGQSRTLVRWFGRLRGCLVAHAVPAGAIRVSARQLTLPVDRELERQQVLNRMFACDRRVGGPPHQSSLQAFDGRLVLYLPKQCLLDEKVLADSRRS